MLAIDQITPASPVHYYRPLHRVRTNSGKRTNVRTFTLRLVLDL